MTQTARESSRSGTIQKLAALAIPFAGAVISLYPNNPNNMTLPSRDSGVFLYVGWRWLNGDIPYRDVWDHKPPLIYVVDALGLSLTPDSLWGVWAIEFLFAFIALFLLFKLINTELGFASATAGVVVFSSGLLTILSSGNVTEEYALLFQILGLVLFVRAWRGNFLIRICFWMGVCAGIAFNFKQTTIGVWAAIGSLMLIHFLSRRKFPWREILALLAGWLLPSLIVGIYFASQNALRDFWEQAYLYNFVYIGKHEGIRRLIPVFTKGFLYLKNGWVLHFAIVGWLTGTAYLWQKRKQWMTEAHPLVLISVVVFPMEVFFVLVSGRSILHYYLTLLPAMALLTAGMIYTTPILFQKLKNSKMASAIPAILLFGILVAQSGQAKYYPQYVNELGINIHEPVIAYVKQNTESDDAVLFIGAESVVNFLARREAPSRYVYQYPLQLLGRRPMFEEFFNDIIKNKPVLIVDTRGRANLTEKLYSSMQNRSEIVRNGVVYLGEHYQYVAQFDDWSVYRLTESPLPSGEGGG